MALLIFQIEWPNTSCPLESSIDQGPYVNVTEDGMVTAVGNSQQDNVATDINNKDTDHIKKNDDAISYEERSDLTTEGTHSKIDLKQPSDHNVNDLVFPVRRQIDQLSRHGRNSIWLLAYIGVITTWPYVGSALVFLKKKFQNMALPRR